MDDDQAALSSLGEALGREGYHIAAAGGGAEALRLLEDITPDLVITDLRMRDVDGMKVLETVRATRKEIPVIVMTAFIDKDTAIEAMRRGAYDYLSKPLNLSDTRMVVRRALEQSQLVRENRRLRTLVSEKRVLPR